MIAKDATVCVLNKCLASQVNDNDFVSIEVTNATELRWINIQLTEAGIINTIAIFNRTDGRLKRFGFSLIRVVTNSNVS